MISWSSSSCPLRSCLSLVASIVLLTLQARAELPPIYNNFDDGNDLFGDGYPSSASGTPGWGTGWTASDASQIIATATTANPLNNGNYYANATIFNSTAPQGVRRQYVSYIYSTNSVRNTFSVNWMPHKISFDYRVDSFSGPVYTNEQSCVTEYVTCNNDNSSCSTNIVYVPPFPGNTVSTNTTCTNTGNRVVAYMTNMWSSRNEFAFISAQVFTLTPGPDLFSSWVIAVQGANDSRVQGPPAPGNRWICYDGNRVTTVQSGGSWVDTGMDFNFGTVYHFEVITDPRDKVYFVIVTDGVTTNRTPMLRWRNFSDAVGAQYTPAYPTFGGQLNDVNATLNFSFDSIAISQLPPELFPPRITQVSPSLFPPPPTNLASVLSFTPSFNFPRFHPASKGLTFVASTSGGGSNDLAYEGNTNYFMATAHTTIPISGIGLVLNGTDVSGSLSISGASNFRKAAYNGLVPNAAYQGVISVTNSAGVVTSQKIDFDTFDESIVRFIEAEDYNYGDGTIARDGSGSQSTVGGLFLDDPTPSDYLNGAYLNQSSGYVDRVGMANTDYFDSTNTSGNAANNAFRFGDAVATTLVADYPRTKYLKSGAREFQVGQLQSGEWMNYTRNFSNGNYTVYLRAASTGTGSGGINSVNLDLVTSDPTQPGQTTSSLGIFLVPYTGSLGLPGLVGGSGLFTNVPLTDGGGSPITVNLSGQQTLRLSALNANNNLQLNYLMLVPDAADTPSVAIATPADGASFSAGATVVLTATASVTNGTISKVEYFNGDTSLGPSTASPFTVNWTSVPTGNYTITAKATTSGGFTAKSSPVRIKVGTPGRRVLFVQGTAANSGDGYVKTMLANKGWSYSVHYDTNVSSIGPEAANGFDLIVVSTTVNSVNEGVVWRDVGVPLLSWSQGMLGRHCFAKEGMALDANPSGSRQYVVVASPGDPAAAGYTGIQAMTTAPATSSLLLPNENATIVTKYTNAPAIWVNDLYYKSGAEMVNGVIAPAVRYYYFLNSASFDSLISPFGSNILSAGLEVAVANPVFTGYPVRLSTPILAGPNATIPFSAGSMDVPGSFSLWSAFNVTGPYTNDNAVVITQTGVKQYQATTTKSSSRMFYRIGRN